MGSGIRAGLGADDAPRRASPAGDCAPGTAGPLRLRHGDAEIVVLIDGFFPPPAGVVAPDASAAEWADIESRLGGSGGTITACVNLPVIRHGDELTVVDLGGGHAAPAARSARGQPCAAARRPLRLSRARPHRAAGRRVPLRAAAGRMTCRGTTLAGARHLPPAAAALRSHGRAPAPHRPWRWTTRPPSRVIRARVSRIRCGSTARMSCDSTTRSASLPGSIEPSSASAPSSTALSRV